MITADRLKHIDEYYFSRKLREIEIMKQQGLDVINLGIGSPDLMPHHDVIRVMQEEALKSGNHGYQSYKGIPELRKAVADWYDQWYQTELDAATEILPLIGSKEGIMHICMTFLNEGDIALIPNPGYPTYRSAVQLAGAACREYILDEAGHYEPDFEALEKQGLENVKLMWVSYPHMPTGQAPSENLFQKLIDFGKKHQIIICHDNPYSFILNEEPRSILKAEGAKDIALELNSLSKSHNMAGWRIGFLCGNSDMINNVVKFKSNMDSGMFKPLQLAAVRALQLEKDWFIALNDIYRERRAYVFKLLNQLGCSYSEQQVGLFVWARIPADQENGFHFSDEILNRFNVFITPGGIFGSAGDHYIRVSLCSSKELIKTAAERIKNFL
jgi:LL-diaminopimelate aminotransferase